MPDQPFSPDDIPQNFSIMTLTGGISPFDYAMNGVGVYIVWERRGDTAPAYYQVLRSQKFEGYYETLETIPAPADSYTDANGHPTYYYKIREIAPDMTVAFTSGPISAEELLVNQSLYYQIQGVMNHRVNNEGAILERGRKSAIFTFKNWNTLPKPEIRINCSNEDGDRDPWLMLDDATPIQRTYGSTDDYPDGLKIKSTWNGKVHFVNTNDEPVAIHEYNEIEASYHIRIFKHSEIRNAMQLALSMLNAQPGTSKYPFVAGLPPEYDAGLIIGAAYNLYRQLHAMCMNPEIRLLLLDPERGAFESMSHLRETIKLYEEDWKELLKTIPKARYPQLRTIVTPEYAMPGGRSRMFRYLWKGGGAG
jgi:hypothetical protein